MIDAGDELIFEALQLLLPRIGYTDVSKLTLSTAIAVGRGKNQHACGKLRCDRYGIHRQTIGLRKRALKRGGVLGEGDGDERKKNRAQGRHRDLTWSAKYAGDNHRQEQ